MNIWDGLLGLLSLAGTGFGMYSNYANQQSQENAYRDAIRQQNAYDAQVNRYYSQHDNYQRALLQGMMGAVGQMMGAANSQMAGAQGRLGSLMATPVDAMPYYNQYYKPLTDAEVAGLRRGITAQQALRTNGNEGMYVDALVGEGVNKRESAISQAALDRAVQTALGQRQGDVNLAQADVQLASSFMNMLPSILSGTMHGFAPPPQPIRPMQTPYPTYSPYPTDALGGYMKYMGGKDWSGSSKPQDTPPPSQTQSPIPYMAVQPSVYDPYSAIFGPYEWPW